MPASPLIRAAYGANRRAFSIEAQALCCPDSRARRWRIWRARSRRSCSFSHQFDILLQGHRSTIQPLDGHRLDELLTAKHVKTAGRGIETQQNAMPSQVGFDVVRHPIDLDATIGFHQGAGIQRPSSSVSH
ncbi:MAG TPA: hypothetical protein VKR06_17235 [Ktedonosporobacter sp.]|nr:hypothetical protein [Ktedonosporobacter sp.]